MDAVRVRDSFQAPSHSQGELGTATDLRHRVIINHPGYDDLHNTLLILQASDHANGGFHHETARVACAIIADNRWDGFLSSTRDGPEVDVPRKGILAPGQYYFQLPSSTEAYPPEGQSSHLYPIIPRFRDWRFPHDDIPELWNRSEIMNVQADSTPQRSDLSAVLAARDHNCRLSGFEEGTTVAHICPKAENHWFHSNAMQRYIVKTRRSGPGAINDPSNVLLLRQDLHTAFDAQRLTFLPKTNAHSGETLIVAHVWASSSELTKLYHNVALRPLKGVSIEFLFARFAMSIFFLVEGFLQGGIPRLLSVDGATSQDTRMFTSEECFEIPVPPPRLRSTSAKKRGLAAEDEAHGPSVEDRTGAEATEAGYRPCKRHKSSENMASSREVKYIESGLSLSSRTSISNAAKKLDEGPDPPWCTTDKLASTYLQVERARSDPNGSWKVEERWLEDAMQRPLSAFEVPRLMKGLGYEVFDEGGSPF